MRKDPTEFRARFKAYKEGKMPYDAGRPAAIQEVDKSDADFAKRLRSNWRQEIWDWEGSGKAATHKMGSFDNIVYPNVQTTEGGGLIDFTNPIWKGVVDPRQRAIQHGDFVPMKTESDAIWFGPNYKKYYPGFKTGNLPKYGNGTDAAIQLAKGGASLIPGVGTLIDGYDMFTDPSLENLGYLALSGIGDAAIFTGIGAPFGFSLKAIRQAAKLNKTRKTLNALNTIGKAGGAVQLYDAKKAYRASKAAVRALAAETGNLVDTAKSTYDAYIK